MKIKINKEFDSVKVMREIRDQFSKEILNMSFQEEKAYLKKLLEKKRSPNILKKSLKKA